MSAGPNEANERGTSDRERGTSKSERGTSTEQDKSQVVRLTVDGATQGNVTGDKNWAAVKKSGAQVLVTAETSPHNDLTEWKKLRWNTGNPVPGRPNQRRISRAISKKYHLEATLGSSGASVDVWIIWAKILIMTRGLRPANAALFDPAEGVGPDRLGAIAHVGGFGSSVAIDADAGDFVDGWFAAGRICAVATLTPSRISTVIASGWQFKRAIDSHDFVNGEPNKGGKSWVGWVDDTSPAERLRLTPDSQDKIYDVDAPSTVTQVASTETYNNFRQWVEFGNERCSDLAPWFWRARWKLNRDPKKQITLKEVGTGKISLPSQAYYRKK